MGPEKLAGIGVASPDDMPHAATLPHQPANYNIWATTDIPALLQKTLHVPVFVENDAAAATIGEMQFGLGKKYQTFFYILITAALGGSLVIEGHHYRGATGRSGELGLLEGKDIAGRDRQIQEIVSLSGLFGRLAAQGIVVSSPQELARLNTRGHAIVDAWTESAVDTLLAPVISINCLFNPQAILIGGRLPAGHCRQPRDAAESETAFSFGQGACNSAGITSRPIRRRASGWCSHSSVQRQAAADPDGAHEGR